MNDSKENNAELEYMIRRSISILLGDLRRWKKELHSVGVGVNNDDGGGTLEGPILIDLLLLFNLWRSAFILSETLLEPSFIPKEWKRSDRIVDEENLRGPVDWQKTFNHWQKGGKGFSVKGFSKRVAETQAQFLALVLAEFLLHSEIIIDRVNSSLGGNTSPGFLSRAIEEVKSIQLQIGKFLRDQLQEFANSVQDKLKVAESALTNLIEGFGSNLGGPFSAYIDMVPIRCPKGTSISSIVKDLSNWREEYLNCKITFSENDILEYRRGGNIADLYEIWCFFEICAAIKRQNMDDVIQMWAIQRRAKEPQFKIGEHSHCYFDFHSLSFLPADKSQILPGLGSGPQVAIPGVFVEWFIEDLKEYQKSLCIDTKFAEWRSDYVLKVLGYSVAYGVDNVALILKDKIVEETIGGEFILPELHKVNNFKSKNKNLWVISLYPSVKNEQSNKKILDRFVVEHFAERQK